MPLPASLMNPEAALLPPSDSLPDAQLWPACADQLAQNMPVQMFNTWIKPLDARLSSDGQTLHLHVPNRFKLDWIRAQYVRRIGDTLQQLAGRAVSVELVLTPVVSKEKERLSTAQAAAAAGRTAPPPTTAGDGAQGGAGASSGSAAA